METGFSIISSVSLRQRPFTPFMPFMSFMLVYTAYAVYVFMLPVWTLQGKGNAVPKTVVAQE